MTGGDSAGDFLKLLRNGADFGLEHLRYAYQEGEGGIAEALALAEFFAAAEPVVVILGDNIFQHPVAGAIETFRKDPSGAMILLKEVDDPQRFGVAKVDGDRVVSIVEKPATPPTIAPKSAPPTASRKPNKKSKVMCSIRSEVA